MNDLFGMLTKAGYEAGSIGDDVLPCTLRIGEEPIGFLMDDLSVRLLPEREKERGRIQPILSFSEDNRGNIEEHGEYILSRYQNVVFTAAFDYGSSQPVYNIYMESKDKGWTLLDSTGDKAAAGREFASRSGLAAGGIPEPARKAGRIARFMKEARVKGFDFRESRAEAGRTYDILDHDGHEVGFIGKDNRVTVLSETDRIRKALTGAYLDSRAEDSYLPSFFEKLKERLKAIGMALKVAFTPKGRRYAIHNAEQKKVASVEEKTHEVTYTSSATDEEKAKIDALVEEIRQEEAQKEQKAERQEPKREAVSAETPSVSAEEIRRVTDAVLSDRAAAETFLDTILSNPQFRTLLNRRVQKVQQTKNQEVKHPAKGKETSVQEERNPEREKLRQEFSRDYDYLQTLFGFNREKYEALRADMVSRYGTDDPKQFQALLNSRQPESTGKLSGRLKQSEKIAEMENRTRNADKPQEKERA